MEKLDKMDNKITKVDLSKTKTEQILFNLALNFV